MELLLKDSDLISMPPVVATWVASKILRRPVAETPASPEAESPVVEAPIAPEAEAESPVVRSPIAPETGVETPIVQAVSRESLRERAEEFILARGVDVAGEILAKFGIGRFQDCPDAKLPDLFAEIALS